MRDTLAGLVVLGLVLAGVFWARGWRPWGDPAPAGAGLGVVPGTDAEATIPDVTRDDGIVQLGDVRITLSVSPRPPVAFAKTRFRVRVESADGARNRSSYAMVPLADGQITFEMAMPMGEHRYTFVSSPDGWQEAEVVLPECRSAKRWYVTVEGTLHGQRRSAVFRLDLNPPAPAPPG